VDIFDCKEVTPKKGPSLFDLFDRPIRLRTHELVYVPAEAEVELNLLLRRLLLPQHHHPPPHTRPKSPTDHLQLAHLRI
jgi:hypothetical protein